MFSFVVYNLEALSILHSLEVTVDAVKVKRVFRLALVPNHWEQT